MRYNIDLKSLDLSNMFHDQSECTLNLIMVLVGKPSLKGAEGANFCFNVPSSVVCTDHSNVHAW